MERRVLKALIEAGAVRRVECIANGGSFYIEMHTSNGRELVTTAADRVKTWRRLDSAAKWLHDLGIGKARINIEKWHPGQATMAV